MNFQRYDLIGRYFLPLHQVLYIFNVILIDAVNPEFDEFGQRDIFKPGGMNVSDELRRQSMNSCFDYFG